MQASCWKVEDLIPHRPPMVFLEGIRAFDAEACSISACFTGCAERRGNWFALEYMAQAAAALAGAMDRVSGTGEPSRPGLLLGARKLDLGIEEFVPGVRYVVKAVRECEDGDAARFACEIESEAADGVRCSAVLTVCRTPAVPEGERR